MYAETQRCAATVKCNAVTHPLAAIDLSERWAPAISSSPPSNDTQPVASATRDGVVASSQKHGHGFGLAGRRDL